MRQSIASRVVSYHCAVASLIFLSVSLPAHGQEESGAPRYKLKEIVLDEVVVTGTGTAHYLKDAPVLTEVITARDIAKYSGSSLEEILGMLTPSLSFSPGDMGGHLKLNGLKNDYVLILINGRRINGDVGGQNDLSVVSPTAIERIEIVKGATSSLYGSDAIGGVINIITKKNRDRLGVHSSTRLGSYGDLLRSASLGIIRGRFSADTHLSLRHTDGWQTTTQEWDHHTIKEGSISKAVNTSTNLSVSQEIQYRITPRLGIAADALLYTKEILRPTGPWRYYLNDYQYRNQDYGVGLKWIINDRNDQLTLHTAYGIYRYYFDYTSQATTNFFNPETGRRIVFFPGDRVLQTEQARWLSHLKGTLHLFDNHLVSAGVEYRYDQLVAPYRLSKGKRQAYSIESYLQDEWRINSALQATMGLRLVYHQYFGFRLTPRLALMYRQGDLTLRGTYAMGLKNPTPKELFQNYITSIMGPLKAYYGNAQLRPQASDYLSVGAEYTRGNLRVHATAYYNSIKDMIALKVVPTSPEDRFLEVQETMKYYNLAHGRTYGLDAALTWHLNQQWSTEVGYSYNDARAQYTDDPRDPNYMQYMPMNGTMRHSGSLRISWTNPVVDLSLYGRAQSTKYYISNGHGAPFMLWRLNAHRTLVRTQLWTIEATAGIDNVLDYVDRTPYGRNRGTSTAGRTYFVQMSMRFKSKSQQ